MKRKKSENTNNKKRKSKFTLVMLCLVRPPYGPSPYFVTLNQVGTVELWCLCSKDRLLQCPVYGCVPPFLALHLLDAAFSPVPPGGTHPSLLLSWGTPLNPTLLM